MDYESKLVNCVPLPGLVRSAKAFEQPTRRIASWSMTLLVLIGVLAVIYTVIRVDYGPAHLTYVARRDSLKAPLNVLVVGDWGRKGQYNQSLVAQQMGKVGEDISVKFIISSGDNFYNDGLEGIDDALFEESFSQIYQAPSLQKTWYAVLGNHDYRGNPEVQVDNSLKLKDPRWYCEYSYTIHIDLGHSGIGESKKSYVDFFFIDTSPFQEDYWIAGNTKYKWTRSISREDAIAYQLKNLTAALEASTSTWKVVVGHHTMFSYGLHGDTAELIENVLPTLEANSVDMYVNGHDHCLQHIKPSNSNIHFVTSGGGSKAWKGGNSQSNPADSKLYYDGQGFISISLSPTILQVNFYDISGSIIHQMELKK